MQIQLFVNQQQINFCQMQLRFKSLLQEGKHSEKAEDITHSQKTKYKQSNQLNLFKFSSTLKSKNILLVGPNVAKNTTKDLNNTLLMQPCISPEDQITSFTFKINQAALNFNWIAIGMVHKKQAQDQSFGFTYRENTQGFYILSSNAGVWASTEESLNNKVNGFRFGNGDLVTCMVVRSEKTIYFMRQKSEKDQIPEDVFKLPYSVQNSENPLHPCVVFYHQGDSVEYIPSHRCSQPHYQFKFSKQSIHHGLQLVQDTYVSVYTDDFEYRTAICAQSLETTEQPFQRKKFTFKIVTSNVEENWIGMGMCHINTAKKNQYTLLDQKSIEHGYYMISSNGGSWSTLESHKNNTLKSFRFGKDDPIECEVIFENSDEKLDNRIIFTKGENKYQLNFKRIQGNPLHPCVMLFYSGDRACIVPYF